jgi:LuxR family maltose regulon positive regulatory protein
VLEAALAEATGVLARARDMLAQARARGAGEGYVRVFVDERPARAPTTNARTPLSKREQELLGMLAGGLSNQDIADRLVMTVGTVKWYLHHLYGKIGVRGRLAAIARGRELGLLT